MDLKLSLAHDISARVEEWIAIGKPRQSGFDWKLDPWLRAFPEHEHFLRQLKYRQLGFIDRQLVKDVAARPDLDQEKVFLAVMIWGYGTVGYGPHRVRNILDQKSSTGSIRAAHELLQKGEVANAYDVLITDGPDGLGPAFGTKYLYFAAGDSCEFRPLILDRLIAEAVNEWGRLAKPINSLKSDSQGYVEYLRLMSEAADIFGITEDDLEEVLFSNMARDLGSTTWVTSAVDASLQSSGEFYLGLLLASEILIRDEDLRLTFTAPGGGQYDNLTLVSESGERKANIEINLNGSFLYPSSTPVRFTWSELKAKGIQGTLKLLSEPLGISLLPLPMEEQSRRARDIRVYVSNLIRTVGDGSPTSARVEIEKRIAELSN